MKNDVGYCKVGIKALVLKTIGFDSLPIDDQEFCFRKTLDNINPRTDFIAFKPSERKKEYFDDDGRTLIIEDPILEKKVYAKLDKYNSGWVITLMLAEEY